MQVSPHFTTELDPPRKVAPARAEKSVMEIEMEKVARDRAARENRNRASALAQMERAQAEATQLARVAPTSAYQPPIVTPRYYADLKRGGRADIGEMSLISGARPVGTLEHPTARERGTLAIAADRCTHCGIRWDDHGDNCIQATGAVYERQYWNP